MHSDKAVDKAVDELTSIVKEISLIEKEISIIEEEISLVEKVIQVYDIDGLEKKAHINSTRANRLVDEYRDSNDLSLIQQFLFKDFKELSKLKESKIQFRQEMKLLQLKKSLMKEPSGSSQIITPTKSSDGMGSEQRAVIKQLTFLLRQAKLLQQPILLAYEDLSGEEDAVYEALVGSCCSKLEDLPLAIQRRSSETDIPRIKELFDKLNTGIESNLQKSEDFQKLLSDYNLVDLSKKGEIFELPENAWNSSELLRRGMPNAVSVYGPLYIEIKGKNWAKLEGLLQGIKRVLASSYCYGVYGKHLCLVRERSLAFLISYQMLVSGEGISQENPNPIQIWKISLSDFNFLFRDLTNHINQDSNYLLHDYSYQLLQSCKILNLNISQCQVRLVSSLSSKLFHVLIGDGSRVIINNSTLKESFVLKFNPDEERFRTEVAALEVLGKYYYESIQTEHYGLWYLTDSGAVSFFTEKAKLFFQPPDQASPRSDFDGKVVCAKAVTVELKEEDGGNSTVRKEWFNSNPTITSPTPGSSPFVGTLCMRYGQAATKMDGKLYQDVMESLELVHRCNILHRDIRSSNLLFFPYAGKFLLIDFDLSVILAENQHVATTRIVKHSQRAISAPAIIRKVFHTSSDVVVDVEWSKSNDICMFIEYCLRKGLQYKDLKDEEM